MSLIRTRWAAIGAAVAVTLGGGGIAMVSATSPAGAVTYVPITPCRVFDTRPDFNVGPKATPIGSDTEHAVTATGTTGECTAVPTNATAVAINLTAVGATLPTFLAVYATGADRPNSSNLNPQPGQPPTPNAVTTELSTDGRFSVYNRQGNVDAFADIVGYYTDHTHDDRYYTKNQSNDRYYTKGQSNDRYYTRGQSNDRYYTKAESDARYNGSATNTRAASTYVQGPKSGTSSPAAEVTIEVPSVGYVSVHVTALASNDDLTNADGRKWCSITAGTTIDSNHGMLTKLLPRNSPGSWDGIDSLSGSRMFRISSLPITGTRTYRLVCEDETFATISLSDIHLTATFIPDPGALVFPT